MIHWKNIRHFRLLWRVMIKPKPQSFYKFHSSNNYLFELLKNNSLWASGPDKLNDPYDSNFDITKTFLKNFLDEIKSSDYKEESGITPENLDDAKDFFLESLDEEILNDIQNIFFRNNLGVCCFTTDPRSELMWSHYAESGSGVCLEFSFKNDSDIKNKIVPIEYSDKRTIVNNKIDRVKGLFKKRKVWSYENEWRLLHNVGLISFVKTDLVGMIFGPRCSQEHINSIQEICKEHGYQIEFSVCLYTKVGIQIKKLN